MKKNIFILLLSILLVPGIAFGELVIREPFSEKAGDATAGKVIYDTNCVRCHGEKGDGEGPDAGNMYPKPRNFTTGLFKFKTSAFKEKRPLDRDIYNTVSNGLPGSAMPAWKSSLSIGDRKNVIAYVKQLAKISGEAKDKINMAGWVPPTEKNLKKGKKLFLSRCSPCHGDAGRGDTTMSLEDEWGGRVWPRNFSKFYSFRIGNSPMEIFQRISTGIPGTPMPSFEDPEIGEDVLNTEQKWLVANYVASLEDRARFFDPTRGKILDAWKTDALPEDIEDTEPWQFSKPLTFGLTPQAAPGRPPLNTLIDTVTVRALNDGKEVALLVEWDDPSMSVLDDDDAATIIGDEDVFDDAVALYMPAGVATDNPKKPFFGMGDEKTPVNAWYLNSSNAKKKFTFRGSEKFDTASTENPCNPCAKNACNPCAKNACNPCAKNACNPCAKNACNPCAKNACNPCAKNACNPCAKNACNPCGKTEASKSEDSSFLQQAMYDKGRWTVYMKRPIKSSGPDDAKLEVGKASPIAFSIWDGSNNEKGLTHTFTDWYWLNILPQGKGGRL
ncbi:MAG: hypothetical protein CMH78_01505 [Nitrospinae bacterium]|nr:hypothetical protein [Nitrospinota bacterium]